MKLLILLLFISSCAGYKYRDKENPFMQFGIKSISIPMFYNHSNFANVEGVFTKEIYNTMLDYKGLMLRSGHKNADAVLIGILETRDRKRDTVISSAVLSMENIYGQEIFQNEDGKRNRDDVFLSTQNNIEMSLRIMVIKQPTKEEIVFLSKKIGEKAIGSKIIFNETIALSGAQVLKQLRGESIKVVGTHNRGIERNAIEGMAKTAAARFKDMILYAF